MTVKEFMKASEGHFGPWQRTVLKMSVADWLAKRSPAYLDIMWPLLRDGRAVAYGAPDNKALTDLHVEVCDRLDLDQAKTIPFGALKQIAGPVKVHKPVTQEDIDSWPMIENATGDRWLSPKEREEAMHLVFAKLKAKDDATRGVLAAEKETERAVKSWF